MVQMKIYRLKKKLLADFELKYSTKFLKLRSCFPHHVHNTFRKALQKLDIDTDQFACDVHFFFKLSSARREDYTALEEVTNATAWYALRHVSSRWPALKPVIRRLLEQSWRQSWRQRTFQGVL